MGTTLGPDLNIFSGSGKDRHLRGSVQQQEGDGTLGDRCAENVQSAESTSSVPQETEGDLGASSAGC